MPAPAELIRHGSLAAPVLTALRIRRTARGLDEGTLVYHCLTTGIFHPQTQCPFYPGLRINDVDENVLPGIIEATLHVSGLMTGNTRRISLDWDENPFGWDTCTEDRVERTSKASVAWGTALTGFANMRYLGGSESHQLDGQYMRRSLQYKGIRREGLVHRRATVNGNVVSPSEPIFVNLPGGDGLTPHRYNVSLPRIVVIETHKTTVAPDMTVIPGTVFAPVSGFAFPTVSTVPAMITGDDLAYNWPWGWEVKNIEPDQLAASIGIYVTTYTYEYVWETQF
jgi:hypothetical protein